MEMSILQQIRKKAGHIIEPQLLKTGRVLELRAWSPATVVEVDLHLPLVNMHLWQEVPYIKVRVDDLTYRDYTPAAWDADTSTCTLFINTGHTGAGSSWARNLLPGHVMQYVKTGTTRQGMEAVSAAVALGDESSISHLLALQQLAPPATHFSGAVLIAERQHRAFFEKEFKSPIRPIAPREQYGRHTLVRWIDAQQYEPGNTVFYLTGNSIMVSHLRKRLKQEGVPADNIKAQGFWQ